MHEFTCPFCKRAFDVASFLFTIRGYSTATDSGIAPCPQCDTELEFRVRSGGLDFGYTYWSGSFHFEAMETVRLPGIRKRRSGSSVTLELNGRVLPVPP